MPNSNYPKTSWLSPLHNWHHCHHTPCSALSLKFSLPSHTLARSPTFDSPIEARTPARKSCTYVSIPSSFKMATVALRTLGCGESEKTGESDWEMSKLWGWKSMLSRGYVGQNVALKLVTFYAIGYNLLKNLKFMTFRMIWTNTDWKIFIQSFFDEWILGNQFRSLTQTHSRRGYFAQQHYHHHHS